MPRLFALSALSLAVALSTAAQAAPNTERGKGPTQDSSIALVQLHGEPLATYVKTKPAKGKKIDFGNTSTKAYRAQLSALRNDFKAWLRQNLPQAAVSGEFDLALNAVAVKLNGASLAQLQASPLVKTAQYQGIYYPVGTDPDLAVIRAEQAWASLGGSNQAGAGVKVAIVDSGIDVGHPCFSDAGYAAQAQLGDRRFTNNKVIAAKVFNMKAGSRGYTAEAIDSHGTHVAGTVACNYQTPTTVDGVALPYAMSGVAPRALLGNYNVFPADVGNARSEDILNALEAAYQDGFDVANMSLGGGAQGVQDLLTVAVDNLDQANMIVAVAAGNDGPGERTVGSPGSAERALTAGASSVGHEIVHLVQLNATPYASTKGDFGAGPATAPLAVLNDASSPYNGLSEACSPFAAGSLNGRIALITRGTCDFSVKVRNVQAAGGVGAVVVNRVPGLMVMGQNGDGLPQPSIPAYMVDQLDVAAFKAADGVSTTLPQFGTYQANAAKNDLVADFTSEGPTDVDFRIKPDVMAPGVNIVSSIPRAYCGGAPCFAFFNGTSMATPHLAGSAALLRQAKPDWSAVQVRSALVNTADRKVIKDLTGTQILSNANLVGTGRVNLPAALGAAVSLDPVSLSFGPVPSGSGQAMSRTVTLTNTSGAAQTLSLAIVEAQGSGVGFSVSNAPITLAAGASTTVQIGMSAAQGAAMGNKQAVLQVKAGAQVLAQAMLYVRIK
ncbi:S8 family serine peptidase [Inhella proteolytica]|uniref:S8 family serine peptidase n=1 Tax=Inhella proteolytica TaxID=2795029 RepID=A0A931NIS6_9BURK|nr:S8 family serine peptidase [Inhella proteolytica]MBH9578329.1 S8 family serine peptidase [Inhella proteolytica]